MPAIEFLGLLLLGLATGVLGGYLGIGGALMITPVFLAMLKADGVADAMRFKLAFGTSLLAISGTALSAAISYARMRRIHWQAVRITAVFALLFSFLGSGIAAHSPSFLLQLLFVLFALTNAALLLSPLKIHPDGNQDGSFMKFATIGIFAGLVSALIGVAGGVLMVPLFMFWSRLPAEQAPGTSSAVGVITSISGAAGYVLNGLPVPGLPEGAMGYLMPAFAIPVLAGALLGGPIGSRLNKHFGSGVFRKVFAAFLIAVAIKILFAP